MFITLEGGEGTGKTTLARALAAELERIGQEVVLTREPGGTPGAEHLRDTLLNQANSFNWNSTSEILIVFAARCDHLEKVIKPALNGGKWVICDRFTDSTIVYQAGLNKDLRKQIERIDSVSLNGFSPELTLLLDGDPAQLLSRRQNRGAQDVFEARDLTFHKQVRASFLDLQNLQPERIVVLDALQSEQDLLSEALNVIAERTEETNLNQ